MAVRLAAVTGATVHLVWAVEPPIASIEMHVYSGYLAEELCAAAAYLDAVHRQTAGDSVHEQAQQRVGGAVFALLQYERAADIDLLVMPSRKEGSFEPIWKDGAA